MHQIASSCLSFARAGALTTIAVFAVGCNSDSGPSTQQNSAGPQSAVTGYAGPAPATADVQAFKINLYDNVRTDNRCGSCHGVDGGQSPMFARSDDVNLAYAAANTIVSLQDPESSVMVGKVGGGHNCWLTSDAACAEILTTWISNWAGETSGAAGRKIELEPPLSIRDPGQSRNFPDDDGAWFGATVYPVLNDANQGNCGRCHSSGSTVQQSPFFAEGPAGDADAIATAYEAAKSKMNLDDPDNSRFVQRLREESHNCWTSSCEVDAAAISAAIASFAGLIQPTEVDSDLVTSKALTLFEGTIAAGGNRHEANQIALFEFKTGGGATAFDTSGVDPAMDLTLSGNVSWVGGWGLNFSGGKAQATASSSAKLRDQILATGEYSIEAWVAPGNVVQENTRIVSYSGSQDDRNFNLGQTMYNYDFFNRLDSMPADLADNGEPRLSTPDEAEVLQATLQHVVVTFDPVEGRKIYVNGLLSSMPDPEGGGTLNGWDDIYAFVLGNEVSGLIPWTGVLRMVSVHNRALTPEQILQNFDAGVGERFFLLFSVSHLVNVPQSYIVFEASVFDSYAYLFRQPFFISLDETAQPAGIDIEGLRIGINGEEASVGQAFAHVDEVISSVLYDSETGQQLAALGTVVPLEKGPLADEFFLTFDRLGTNVYSRPPAVTPNPPTPVDLPPASAIGVRTFDEINATMAAITGVSPLDVDVHGTFDLVRQSLPAVPTIEAVLASHQVAVAQLSIEYCNAAVDNTTTRNALWGGTINWGLGPASQPAGWTDTLAAPLIRRMLIVAQSGTQLGTQPLRADIENELAELVNGGVNPSRPGLAATDAASPARTVKIAKAACAAMLGSAVMLLQ